MGIFSFLRAAIASLLQPWILQPDLLHSLSLQIHKSFQIVLELPRIEIDYSTLNECSAMSSSLIILNHVHVDSIKVTISLFHSPGLLIEIHGTNIVGHPRPSGDTFWSVRAANNMEHDKRNAIFALDPQGAAMHLAAENHTRDRSDGNLLWAFFVDLLLETLQVDWQNVSLEVHSNTVDGCTHQCSASFTSLLMEGESSIVGAFSRRLVNIFRKTEKSYSKSCSITGAGLKSAAMYGRTDTHAAARRNWKDCVSNQMSLHGYLLLWKEVSLVLEVQSGHLKEIDTIFPETVVQMDVVELQAILVIVSQLQGLSIRMNSVQDFRGREQRTTSARHLWQKAVQKIKGGSWRRFKGIVQTGMLRHKYTQCYLTWILETGVGQLNGQDNGKSSRTKTTQLKALQEGLLEMERELPVEAVVLARFIARRKVQEIIKDGSNVIPKRRDKLLFWMLVLWQALKSVFGTLMRYLKEAFVFLHFCSKRIFTYFRISWLVSRFIVWALALRYKYLAMMKHYRSSSGSQSAETFSKRWIKLRNKKDVSVFGSRFHTGSITLLGPLESSDLNKFKEKVIEQTVKGVCFSWGNISAVHIASYNKMVLELSCEYVHGEFITFPFKPMNREEHDGNVHVTKEIRWGKFLLSNPAPPLSPYQNIKRDFKCDNALLGEFLIKDNEATSISNNSELSIININVRPFLLLSLEAFNSTVPVPDIDSNILNCSLAVGRLDCDIEFRSFAQLGYIFRQYSGGLMVNHKSSQSKVSETVIGSRGAIEVLNGRIKQFMSAIVIRRSIRLSAAVVGPELHFSLPDTKDNTKKHALVISLGNFDAIMWPPKLEESFQFQNKADELNKWLRKPPPLHVNMEKIATNEAEHIRIGSNGILSMQGTTLTLQAYDDSEMSHIIGPLQMLGEFSLFREHFVSDIGTNDAMSVSVVISFSSIPVTAHLTEIETLFQDFHVIMELFKKFLQQEHYEFSSFPEISHIDLNNQSSNHTIPLYYALSLMVKVDQFEFILNGKRSKSSTWRTGVSQNKGKKESKGLPAKENKDKPDIPIIHEKCIYVSIKQLWTEFTWGDEYPLSFLFGFQLATLSIAETDSKLWKYEKNQGFSDVPLTSLNIPIAVLSQFCIDQLSFTFTQPLHAPECCSSASLQPDNSSREFFVNFEIAKLYLTDGVPYDVLKRGVSVVSDTTSLLINIVLSDDCENVFVSSKGGFFLLDTEASAILTKEIQLIFSFLSSLKIHRIQGVFPLNQEMGGKEHSLPRIEGSSLQSGKMKNQQPIQQDLRAEILFKDFVWLSGLLCIEISGMSFLLARTSHTSTYNDRGLFFAFGAVSNFQGGVNVQVIDFNTTLLSLSTSDFSPESLLNADQISCVPRFRSNNESIAIDQRVCDPSTNSTDFILEDFRNVQPGFGNIHMQASESEKKNGYILDNVRVSCRIEREYSNLSLTFEGWKGYCSFHGIDIGITLAEIQLILELITPLSSLSTHPENHTLKMLSDMQTTAPHVSTSAYDIPDGAIVTLKDMHEHLYLAVEKTGDTYRLTGVLHHSLVGEQALFKVKYSKQHVNSSQAWFSLLSVVAKNADGEPFRVHYHPGSGLADISSTHDGSWELWQTLPCKISARADDVDVDLYDAYYEHWVYLINQKSKQGLTLANRNPMMIKKPGNPFKLKVFGSADKQEGSVELFNLLDTAFASIPKVEINIDNISFVLLHEMGHGKHLHPLLRGRIENIKSVMHVWPSKTRVMGECKMIFEYFEAHMNRWSMIIQPIDTEVYNCMRVGMKSEDRRTKASSFFIRFHTIDVIVNEYSLDTVLFVLGMLNLAGPYTLKHSPILATSCMVENHTGLKLCCSFHDGNVKRVIKIPAQRSDTFLLRNVTSRRDLFVAEVLSSVCLHLEDEESGVSSPVDISLANPGTTAVRTRVERKSGRRRSPGPVIVVDVSRKSQNGILLTVSPMVRIQNASGLELEMRCRRSNIDDEGVVVTLGNGDVIDDSMGAFNAMDLDGEKRKALSSFNLGNYLLSMRPTSSVPGFSYSLPDMHPEKSMFEWSEDIKGMKPFHISGFFERLQYGITKSIKGYNSQHSFGTIQCALKPVESIDNDIRHPSGMHLLMHSTHRHVSLATINDNGKHKAGGPDAILQAQQELVLLPTMRVFNLLETGITVTVGKDSGVGTETGVHIEPGGRAYLYADLAEPFFYVEIPDLLLKSSHLNVGDWRKGSLNSVDPTFTDVVKDVEMDIDFGDDNCYAKLRILRADDGVLQILVFTQYKLRNTSNNALFFCATKRTRFLWSRIFPWSREHKTHRPVDEHGITINPGASISLLERSSNWLIRMADRLSETSVLDLESFSGSTELSINIPRENGMMELVPLGVALELSSANEMYPTRTVHISSRYIVLNESRESIFVCQDGFQEDENAVTLLEAGEYFSLTKTCFAGKELTNGIRCSGYVGSDMVDPSVFSVRFRFQESQWDWTGPICVNALGSFSLRVSQKQSASLVEQLEKFKFVSIDVEDKRPSLIVHFSVQSADTVPYRVKNALPQTSIFFYQKGVGDRFALLGPGQVAGYAWDDLNQPQKLVVCISRLQIYNEININKLSPWRSFVPVRQKGEFGLPTSLQDQLEASEQYDTEGMNRIDPVNVGYEIYADGHQRVLRVCEYNKSSKSTQSQSYISSPTSKMDFIIHNVGITLFEAKKQMTETFDVLPSDDKLSPILSMRMKRILIENFNTSKHRFFQLKVQTLSVDERWKDAPFAAMVRVHNADRFDISDTVFHMAVVISNQASNPIYVKYASILLQAIDLNLDEETMMKIVPFYRYSLAEASLSHQIFFEHFEINPIKIVASFLPGQPHTDYTSAQETLRALLHSFIKVPAIRGTTVQLNGVLLSHALLTFRQLAIKCLQHYSWYAMRAIYIAKGSKLLPPAFTSLFDDSAASSLDVFFDPANGSVDFQGFTLGMFNLLSEGLNRRGFSGTSRYIGDLERMMKTAGSNIIFAILTEISDNVLKGAETGGVEGMVIGFRRGILNISMEPAFLRSAVVKGGLSRRIKLDRNVGTDEPYIEGYLQAMLDTMFKQDYLRVRVVDDQVFLKNLPPNTMLTEEIVGCVKSFLGREGFLVGETSAGPMHSFRRLEGGNEKRIIPAAVALCEQLFVIFAVRALKNQTRSWFNRVVEGKNAAESNGTRKQAENQPGTVDKEQQITRRNMKGVMLSFVLSSAMAYIDGRLCRHIPNTLIRRVVSGFLLSFVE